MRHQFDTLVIRTVLKNKLISPYKQICFCRLQLLKDIVPCNNLCLSYPFLAVFFPAHICSTFIGPRLIPFLLINPFGPVCFLPLHSTPTFPFPQKQLLSNSAPPARRITLLFTSHRVCTPCILRACQNFNFELASHVRIYQSPFSYLYFLIFTNFYIYTSINYMIICLYIL